LENVTIILFPGVRCFESFLFDVLLSAWKFDFNALSISSF
jgi:hypothetical protein